MADLTPTQQSAYQQANAYLASLGMDPSQFQQMLTDAAVNDYSPAAFTQVVQSSPQFQAAFPEMKLRQQNKLYPMTPAEIVTYRSTARSLAQSYGLPAGFMNNQTITDLIGNGVSPDELKGRIVQGFAAVNDAPQDVKDALLNYYGIDQGHLAAFFLDPKMGEDLIQKAVASSQIGAAGARTHYGLSREEAETLAGGGVTADQAAKGLSALSQEGELFGTLPGEAPGRDITRSEQLSTLLSPGGTTQQELEKRAKSRVAQFQAGGDFGTSDKGVSGLGQG
jgi:hypothetical protein